MVVGNWRREAARFVPDLELLVVHGSDRRERFGEIPRHHLVVTTYPLLNRDHEALFRHDYDTAVLDVGQAVKNPAAGGLKENYIEYCRKVLEPADFQHFSI